MTTLTVTQARQNLFDLLKKSVKGHVPVKITSRTGDAVLLSEEDYEGLIETLELLSTPGMAKSLREARADIRAGRTKSIQEVFGR
ncbi:MAG: type II toxin-antitoxin system Phd/YefM family antitoxin [Candidatus Omnitrophica bacterium]|nr:type II toxin-antitoxin system Phd/YefM family antitoxin [Candidatus Omnitrophota bacterium]